MNRVAKQSPMQRMETVLRLIDSHGKLSIHEAIALSSTTERAIGVLRAAIDHRDHKCDATEAVLDRAIAHFFGGAP